MFRHGSIVKVTTILHVTLIILTALTIGALWTYDIVNIYNQELKDTEEKFLTRNKVIMEGQVERIIEYANRRRASVERVLKEEIKERTYEATAIAQNIYDLNKGELSKQKIKIRIKNALRPIRFNQGRGYFFAVSMNGYEELYPVFPEFEGKYVLDLTDEKGNYVIKDEIEVVKKHGEGYVQDYWKKPGLSDGLIYPKISFVKYFEPLDWYIGTGEYIDNVERDLKGNVLGEVNETRFGAKGQQYLFVTSYEGVELANGGYPDLIGVSVKGLVDSEANKIFENELAAAKNKPEGSYLKHNWYNKNSEGLSSETMTYVRAYKPWNWIIGTSIHTDEMKADIIDLGNKLKDDLKMQIFRILLALSVLLLIALVIQRRISDMVRNTINTFIEFFKSASKEHEEIDLTYVSFDEMKILAQEANSMIRDRRISDDKIHRLSVTDGMTETFNHQHILEKLEEELSAGMVPLSIVLLDADDFKSVNDNYGHLAGDEVLRKIADAMLKGVRAYDSVGRYGGEEFLLVLPMATLKTATEVAERIREKISLLNVPPGIHVTISGGVAEWVKGQTAEEFVQRADDAMYKAKAQGKNCIVQSIREHNLPSK